MQMVKQSADPIKAIILSKEGTTSARTVMIKTVMIRMVALIIVRVNLEAFASLASGDARGSRPIIISIVLDTGAKLKQEQD